MAANTRLATAVQILCVVARKGSEGSTAEVVARSLQTNPVVVRRMLKMLERGGLVALRPGKDGGVKLARPAADITLDAVHRAVAPLESAFALRGGGNPRCPVNDCMPGLLGPIFGAADDAVVGVLRSVTLQSLAAKVAA